MGAWRDRIFMMFNPDKWKSHTWASLLGKTSRWQWRNSSIIPVCHEITNVLGTEYCVQQELLYNFIMELEPVKKLFWRKRKIIDLA